MLIYEALRGPVLNTVEYDLAIQMCFHAILGPVVSALVLLFVH